MKIRFAGLSLVLLSLTVPQWAIAQTVSVVATVETDPVPHGGDSADDPAVWIHPTDPSLSTILGTDKNGGLAVYNLSGEEIQFLPDGELNNVDIRYNFPLDGSSVALVTAGNRSSDSIAVYAVDPATRTLQDVAEGTIPVGLTVYGSCMYRSASTGQYYFFVNSKRGEVEQWHLFDNGAGEVSATLVRTFDVGTQTEGCVADDELGHFYIGEENVGIWKYGAEPQDGSSRTFVDSTSGGHINSDVEGLTLYYASNGKGYLLASSQGASEFVIYEREGNNSYVATFEIISSATIDSVGGTDGIDVTNARLGSAFPNGVFIAQDGRNSGSNQNYKLVRWEDIASAVNPPLAIDLLWDPTAIPGGMAPPDPPTNVTVE